jgi:hypothetical protein
LPVARCPAGPLGAPRDGVAVPPESNRDADDLALVARNFSDGLVIFIRIPDMSAKAWSEVHVEFKKALN